MANTASLYIQQKGTGNQLYKDYFGSNPNGQVIKNFETIWTDNLPLRTLLCPDTCQSDGPAYVSGDSIFFWKIFFGLSNPLFCPSDVPDPQGAPTTIALITLTHAILQMGSVTVECHNARNLHNDCKMGNTDNYVVSTQSPCGLPGAHQAPSATFSPWVMVHAMWQFLMGYGPHITIQHSVQSMTHGG